MGEWMFWLAVNVPELYSPSSLASCRDQLLKKTTKKKKLKVCDFISYVFHAHSRQLSGTAKKRRRFEVNKFKIHKKRLCSNVPVHSVSVCQ